MEEINVEEKKLENEERRRKFSGTRKYYDKK